MPKKILIIDQLRIFVLEASMQIFTHKNHTDTFSFRCLFHVGKKYVGDLKPERLLAVTVWSEISWVPDHIWPWIRHWQDLQFTTQTNRTSNIQHPRATHGIKKKTHVADLKRGNGKKKKTPSKPGSLFWKGGHIIISQNPRFSPPPAIPLVVWDYAPEWRSHRCWSLSTLMVDVLKGLVPLK